MKKASLFITLILLLYSLNSVLAEIDSSPWTISISFVSETDLLNVSDKTVLLRDAESDVYLVSRAKNTNIDGKVLFEIDRSTKIPNLIYGFICNDAYQEEGKRRCGGYPFYFTLFDRNDEVNVKYKGWFFNGTDRRFKFYYDDPDGELKHCGYYILNIDGEIIVRNDDFYQELKEVCTYDFILDETILPPGLYWFEASASDVVSQTVVLQPFYADKISTHNPYNLPAIGNFEILGAECYFLENGKKIIDVPYKPDEKKDIPIFCPNHDTPIEPEIQENYTKENIINFVNLLISGILALVFSVGGSALFYLLINPKSKKRLLTKKIFIISIIIWVILYLLLQFFKL